MSILTSVDLQIDLNTRPTLVDYSQTAQTEEATQGYNVITITPNSNYAANSLIKYGGASKPVNVPAGSPVVYPLIQDFGNNTVQVQNLNTQEGTSLLAGWYALSQSPTYRITNNNQQVEQYKSIGGQSSSSIQTLTLTARSTEATLALLIVGPNKPVPVFLNIDKDNLPPQWSNLDGAIFESGNTYQTSKNFYGQTIYIVNISLTQGAKFDARLQ